MGHLVCYRGLYEIQEFHHNDANFGVASLSSFVDDYSPLQAPTSQSNPRANVDMHASIPFVVDQRPLNPGRAKSQPFNFENFLEHRLLRPPKSTTSTTYVTC